MGLMIIAFAGALSAAAATSDVSLGCEIISSRVTWLATVRANQAEGTVSVREPSGRVEHHWGTVTPQSISWRLGDNRRQTSVTINRQTNVVTMITRTAALAPVTSRGTCRESAAP